MENSISELRNQLSEKREKEIELERTIEDLTAESKSLTNSKVSNIFY